jgi:hypothetical protein
MRLRLFVTGSDFIQHDIVARADVVDILISTTYASAGEGGLDPRPLGLGLRVPLPDTGYVPLTPHRGYMGHNPNLAPAALLAVPDPAIGADGLVDFDQLPVPKVRELTSS